MRWLRPEYQVPRFGAEAKGGAKSEELALPTEAAVAPAPAMNPAWPATVMAQIAALKALAEQAGCTGIVGIQFSGTDVITW